MVAPDTDHVRSCNIVATSTMPPSGRKTSQVSPRVTKRSTPRASSKREPAIAIGHRYECLRLDRSSFDIRLPRAIPPLASQTLIPALSKTEASEKLAHVAEKAKPSDLLEGNPSLRWAGGRFVSRVWTGAG